MNQNNKIRIIEIISKIAKINLDQINESTSMSDFSKWDSLAHLQIMLEIEKKKLRKPINQIPPEKLT